MWYSDKNDSFERINLDFEIHQMIYHGSTKTFVGWGLCDKNLKIITDKFVLKEENKVVSDRTEVISFYDFTDKSKGLRELFEHNQSEIDNLKMDFDELSNIEVPEDGY